VRLAPDLPLLAEAERSCLDRYLALLEETLGDQLLEIAVYGSVARGESWPRGIPIRSDLDLLVLTSKPMPKESVDALVEATMPLFLECGRQLGRSSRHQRSSGVRGASALPSSSGRSAATRSSFTKGRRLGFSLTSMFGL
jgi:predicted nucleotidyltransferase